MSEKQVGSNTVRIDETGHVFIDWGEDCGAEILKEDRPAVALAILGGITDELVELAAVAYWDEWHSPPWSECRNQDDFRTTARSMLNAIFGIEP